MNRTAFRQISQWFIHRSRPTKRIITLLVDAAFIILSLWSAFSLRYSELYIPLQGQAWVFLAAPFLAIPVFVRLGLYRAVMRYIGVEVLTSIFKAVALYTLILATTVVFSGSEAGVFPRTVYGINALILLLLVGGSRLLARWWFADLFGKARLKESRERTASHIVIYGAGGSGVQLAESLKLGFQQKPVAFVDDAKQLHGQVINGLTVYPVDEISYLIQKFSVSDVLLAMPSVKRNRRNEILRFLELLPVHVRSLPDIRDIAVGKVTFSDLHEVDIADLLGREEIEPIQPLLHANVTGKVVMVTGAGGSIGSELCRQIIHLAPKKVILYEINEFNLYNIEKELLKYTFAPTVIPILGSVQDKNRVNRACRIYEIDTIYHAAAYKHVPLVERNIEQGVVNNVFGTMNCAIAAIEAGVDTFVLVSTDKAVRPTNIMGATKRIAEQILQALALEHTEPMSTRFTMVRFGNVLGSSGSVVPLFREQIVSGGPVTVTDPRIIRYFMTIPEAAELVIQAGAMGRGGDVFVLDMGEPVRILDLAKRMIHLSGFTELTESNPDGDIEIIYTGLRPGEKLYEELLIGENVSSTEHKKILRAQEETIQWSKLQTILSELEDAYSKYDYKKIRELLVSYVDGYQNKSDIGDWLENSSLN